MTEAAVYIDGAVCGKIDRGYLVLLGIAPHDTEAEAAHLVEKIVHLRVFSDASGKMNHTLAEVGGAVLVISQFTLFADLKKRRPGFSHAAKPEHAEILYECFLKNHCPSAQAVKKGA